MTSNIRRQADDFLKAYEILSKNKPELNSPAIVNLAFALELYIKDLHYALNKKIPRGHNILELFKKLPLEAQQKIRNYPDIQKLIAFYSKNKFLLYIPQNKDKKPITDVLEQQIHKISDLFQNWRYSYESNTLYYSSSFTLTFIEAIKATADNIHAK